MPLRYLRLLPHAQLRRPRSRLSLNLRGERHVLRRNPTTDTCEPCSLRRLPCPHRPLHGRPSALVGQLGRLNASLLRTGRTFRSRDVENLKREISWAPPAHHSSASRWKPLLSRTPPLVTPFPNRPQPQLITLTHATNPPPTSLDGLRGVNSKHSSAYGILFPPTSDALLRARRFGLRRHRY